MPSIVARSEDIRGLIPAIDSKKKNAVNLLTGANFTWDADGPKSGFGHDFLAAIQFRTPDFMQSILVETATGDRTFIFMGASVLEWDESFGNYRTILLLPFDTSLTPNRWTAAIINEVIFFCHPAVGVWYLDDDQQLRGHLNVPGLLAQPIAIAENAGRLLVLNNTTVQWSAQADGFNHTPQLGGPGLQVIAAKVAGDPIAVASYGAGFLVFTKGGVMKAEFTADEAVYRLRQMPTKFRPVNSFCIQQLDDDSIVILDRRGIYRTKGNPPEPFTPLFNEFLKLEFRKASFQYNSNLRLEWDEERQYAYICTSSSDVTPLYNRTYVLYPPSDKWGSFDESHYGVGNVVIATGSRRGTYFGYIDAEGYFKYFDDSAHTRTIPIDPTVYLYARNDQYPILVNDEKAHTVMPAAVRVAHLRESLEPALEPGGGIAGYYDFDAATLALLPTASLGSHIRVGLFRFSEELYPDEVSEITDISVTSVVSGDIAADSVDYNVVPDGTDDEDYNAGTGGESYGDDPQTYVNFTLRLISTMDGQKAVATNTPTLQRFFNSTRYFAAGEDGVASPIGVWHIIELETTLPGETFHLKQIELNGIIAGRLN